MKHADGWTEPFHYTFILGGLYK